MASEAGQCTSLTICTNASASRKLERCLLCHICTRGKRMPSNCLPVTRQSKLEGHQLRFLGRKCKFRPNTITPKLASRLDGGIFLANSFGNITIDSRKCATQLSQEQAMKLLSSRRLRRAGRGQRAMEKFLSHFVDDCHQKKAKDY